MNQQVEAVNAVADGVCKVFDKLTPLGTELIQQTASYGMVMSIISAVMFIFTTVLFSFALVSISKKDSTDDASLAELISSAISAIGSLTFFVMFFAHIKLWLSPMLYLINK